MGIKIGIDVGGTFTDLIVSTPSGEPVIHKILSTPRVTTTTRSSMRRKFAI